MATKTKYFREKFGYTQKEMSEKFGIPLRTIQNWDSRSCMPDYVYTLLLMYEFASADRMKYRECIRKNLGWGCEMFDVPDDI